MTAATLFRLSPPTAPHLHATTTTTTSTSTSTSKTVPNTLADSPQSPTPPHVSRPPPPPPASLSASANPVHNDAVPPATTGQQPPSTKPHQQQQQHPATAPRAMTAPSVTPPPPNLVLLNVYDVLTPSDATTIPRLNDVLFPLGVGVFHTGVEVWGREFAYGGHPDSDSGIFEVPPRKCPAVRFRMTLPLGTTRLSERAVDRVITALGVAQFAGNRYSLISKNCNTFSKTFAALLGVKDNFPAWVNRLATIAVNVKCILPEAVDLPLAAVVPAVTTVKEPRKPPRVATLAALAPSN